MDNTYSEGKSIRFVLKNNSKDCPNTSPESWTLVIDGKDLESSDMIFGNGLQPTNGWKVLKAGESFDFVKELPLDFFPENRKYSLVWKAKAFKSNTLEIAGRARHW